MTSAHQSHLRSAGRSPIGKRDLINPPVPPSTRSVTTNDQYPVDGPCEGREKGAPLDSSPGHPRRSQTHSRSRQNETTALLNVCPCSHWDGGPRAGATVVTRAEEVVEVIGHAGELASDEERPATLLDAWAPDEPPTFVNAMYRLGAKGFFDATAIHPYVYPNGLAIDDHNGWSDVERVHQLMVDNGDGGKKIWMTEIGAPTSAPSAAGVNQDEQARQITDILWKASESGFSVRRSFSPSVTSTPPTRTTNRTTSARCGPATGSPRWRPACWQGSPPPLRRRSYPR